MTHQLHVDNPIQQPLELYGDTFPGAKPICPEILLHLNVHVFLQLRRLGTTKARVCAVLSLSADQYDYVNRMV